MHISILPSLLIRISRGLESIFSLWCREGSTLMNGGFLFQWSYNRATSTLVLGKTGQKEKGATEDEMVGWHHRIDEHEFEQALGGGDGQGSLVCCSPRGRKELDMTDWLTNLYLVSKTPPVSANFFPLYIFFNLAAQGLIAAPGVFNLHCGLWDFFFFRSMQTL